MPRQRIHAALGGFLLVLGTGCAGVHDRQVFNPSRDWKLAEGRRERTARFKAPFVRLGNRLKSLSEPGGPQLLSVQPLEEWESSAVDP